MKTLHSLLAILTSGDDARAEQVIPAIVELGMAALPDLVELTRAESVDIRWWAVRTLAALPQSRIEDFLPMLQDSSPEVRAAAALAICSHPHADAVPDLINTLDDEDPLTAGLAGNALVRIGPPAVPGLLQVMEQAPLKVRILSLRALAEIQDMRAIQVLMKCLGEDSAVLQYWAREGLERLGLDMVYIKP